MTSLESAPEIFFAEVEPLIRKDDKVPIGDDSLFNSIYARKIEQV